MASVVTAAAVPAALTDPGQAEAARDRTEDQLTTVFEKALRKYLARLRREVNRRLTRGDTIVAATGDPLDPITLGQLAGWWAEVVRDEVIAEVMAAWRAAYGDNIPQSALQEAVDDYLPRVTDRLVRGITPPVAEDSMDKIRTILAHATGQGWSRKQTAARIALELGWETDGPGWRDQLDTIDAEIDAILDPLGHPGNPAREYARLNDPTIRALQEERAELVQQLDAEKSYWQTRANRIARTESTSLHGYASNRALAEEGFKFKKWVATNDSRTREEHAEANGQTVPVDAEFLVGGYTMQFPGDPSAPVELIVNCRCTMVGVEQEPEPDTATSDADQVWSDEQYQDAWNAFRTRLEGDPDALAGVLSYQGNAYRNINRALRRGRSLSATDQEIVDGLQQAFSHADPLDRPLTVYRGVTGMYQADGDIPGIGGILTDPAFVSTTVSRETAEKFTREIWGSDEGSWLMEITLPSGTRAIPLSSGEKEMLLPANARFELLEIDTVHQVLRMALI